MNVSDSQRIATKLESLGYISAPEKEADLVVVNACSVRQHAVDRIWGKFKKWALLGTKQVLVTGCILKADKNKFNVRNVNTFKITQLNDLENIINSNQTSEDADSLEYFNILPKHLGKVAYIPIMTGCDNYCSYCAVPYTRGREVSREIDEILIEVNDAIAKGYKEIMLLGQNVNSYNPKQKKRNQFDNKEYIQLLNDIDKLEEDFKFNFMSSNPHDMSDELITCYSNLKKWPKELHLAMQSGNDKILKKMNRKYSSGEFLALISKLKNQISKIKISTDIIVGFPGETKEQFNQTIEICKKIGFYKAYIFKYSSRPGTASSKMIDDISEQEKKNRFEKLDHLINKTKN